jgi:putative transcriptional regulator
MTKRNLAKELIEGLEEIRAWKRGEARLKTHAFELPRAADVPEIRKALGYSQEEFASLMGVSVGTLRNWEQARREPHGPARSLLLVAAANPAAVRGAFQKLARVQRKRRAGRQRAVHHDG